MDIRTSFGCRIAAGLLATALFLGSNPTASPAQVASALIARSAKGVLCNVPADTPNRLLYTGP